MAARCRARRRIRALSGNHFFARFGGMPVSGLYGFINTQMPLGQAGALGAQGNADVTAYILQTNKFPAGQTELPADMAALRAHDHQQAISSKKRIQGR